MTPEIITNIICGGAVGYSTNSLAVSMLFRRYWRFGGVIERRYNDFVVNMAQLVESDLVNHNTLADQFAGEEFRAVLRQWIADTLRITLPEQSGTLRLEQIDSIEESVAGLISVVRAVEPSLVGAVSPVLFNGPVETFISQEHYNYLIDRNIAALFPKNSRIAGRLVNAAGDVIGPKTFEAVISPYALNRFTQNLTAVVSQTDFTRFRPHIEQTYYELLEIIGTGHALKLVGRSLSGMQINSFVNDSTHLSAHLLKRCTDFADSPEGRELCAGIVKRLLGDAQKIRVSLSDILDPSLKTGVEQFIEREMPGVINRLSRLVRSNRSAIEQMVNDAVDEELDSSLLGKLLKALKDIFISNLADKFNIVGKVASAVDQYGGAAGENLSKELIRYIDRTKIGDIVRDLRSQGVLDENAIVELMICNLRAFESNGIPYLDRFLERRIGDIAGKINLKAAGNELFSRIFTSFDNNWIKNGALRKQLEGWVDDGMEKIAREKVDAVVPLKKIKVSVTQKQVRSALVNSWDRIRRKSAGGLSPTLKSPVNWNGIWEKNRSRQLGELFAKLQKDSVSESAERGLVNVIRENLNRLLEGNVRNVVSGELSKMAPGEISSMVKDFMGKDLKMINFFGLILGSGASVLFFLSMRNFDLPLMWLSVLVLAVYALTGIATNFVAIRMLFHPFKKWFSFLPGCSPFVGVITAGKPKFANSIAGFVKERMLHDGALQEALHKSGDSFTSEIGSMIAKDGYVAIDNLMAYGTLSQKLSNATFNAGCSYAMSRSGDIAEVAGREVSKYVGNIPDKAIGRMGDQIVEWIKKADMAPEFDRFIRENLREKTLGSMTGPFLSFASDGLEKEVCQFIDMLSVKTLKEKINGHKTGYETYVAQTSIKELAGDKAVASFALWVSGLINGMLQDGTLVDPLVRTLRREELHPQKRLRDLFGGAVEELVCRNVTFVITMISKNIQGMKDEIESHVLADMNGALRFVAGKKVRPVISRIVDRKLPAFLKRNEKEFLAIAQTLLDIRLSELGFTQKTLDTDAIRKALTDLAQGKMTLRSIERMVSSLAELLTEMKLQDLLHMLNIRSVKDMVTLLEPLLTDAVCFLEEQAHGSRKEMVACVGELAENVVQSVADQTEILTLLDGIDLEKESRFLLSILMDDPSFVRFLKRETDRMLRAVLRKKHFYSSVLFQRDLQSAMDTVLLENRDKLCELCVPYIEKILLSANGHVDNRTKDAVVALMLDAAFASLKLNVNELIQVVDIREVIEREFNAMEPKQVKKLFKSFAGDYFTKLIWYGWIGMLLGIPVLILLFLGLV